MAVLIVSKEKVKSENTLKSIAEVAFKTGMKFYFEEPLSPNGNGSAEVYISKHYDEEDAYFYLRIEAEKDLIESYNVLKKDGNQYYRLGVTDQADYDRLIYDFSLAYLQLNPDHFISLYGDNLISLSDMEKIESNGGYYKDWCFDK